MEAALKGKEGGGLRAVADCAEPRRWTPPCHLRQTWRLPRNLVPVAPEPPRRRAGLEAAQPDDAVDAFGDGARRLGAAHVGAHPAGAGGVGRRAGWAVLGVEVGGEAVERCL